MSAFTFCTVQYESGDWDSAPQLPANVIDSVEIGRASCRERVSLVV